MGLLYGRAGRLKAQNGGFRPGQWESMLNNLHSTINLPEYQVRHF
jgi:hypothetical protein